MEGFSLNVTDYLLKPIEFERFMVAVNKVAALSRDRNISDEHEAKDYLFLNVQKKKVKISFDEILFIESQKEYIKIVTSKKEFVSKLTTHEIESMLPQNQFRRIHRSYIIALKKVESYTADEVEINGVTIPIGRAYKDIIELL